MDCSAKFALKAKKGRSAQKCRNRVMGGIRCGSVRVDCLYSKVEGTPGVMDFLPSWRTFRE
jgi:hypothetical protein